MEDLSRQVRIGRDRSEQNAQNEQGTARFQARVLLEQQATRRMMKALIEKIQARLRKARLT